MAHAASAVAVDRYWAFLSYAHEDNRVHRHDGVQGCVRWAEWLHRELETYRVPKDYLGRSTPAGEAMPERFYPVFQDEKELPLAPDLDDRIKAALRASLYLVVIASPRSARSTWVDREVAYFRSLGRVDRVLTLIIDGEPNSHVTGAECFCPALRFEVGPDGRPDPQRPNLREPIAGDLRIKDEGTPREARQADWKVHRDVFEAVRLKLIAGLIGVEFDELFRRDRVRHAAEMRRRLGVVSAVAVVLAALAIVAVVSGFRAWQLQAVALAQSSRAQSSEAAQKLAAQVAREQRKVALENEAAALRNLRESLINSARLALDRGQTLCERGKLKLGMLWFARALETVPPDVPDLERVIRVSLDAWRGHIASIRCYLADTDGKFTQKALSPDGKRVAMAGNDSRDPNAKNTFLYRWDAVTGQRTGAPIGLPRPPSSIAFSPDGKQIITTDEKASQKWDSVTGQPAGSPVRAEVSDPQIVVRARAESILSPDRKTILRFSENTAQLVQAGDGKAVGQQIAHNSRIRSALFSPDGSVVLTSSEDGSARLWDTRTGKPRADPLVHGRPLVGMQFGPGGNTFITVAENDYLNITIYLWKTETCKLIGNPLVQPYTLDRIRSFFRYSPDGRLILIAGDRGRGGAQLYDAGTCEPCGDLLAHSGRVSDAVFAPDGRALLTRGDGRFMLTSDVKIWDLGNELPVREIPQRRGRISSVDFSPDGTLVRVVTLHAEGPHWRGQRTGESELLYWDVSATRAAHDLRVKGHYDISFSPDGGEFLLMEGSEPLRHGREMHYLSRWQLWNRAPFTRIGDPIEQIDEGRLVFSPDGKSLLGKTPAIRASSMQLWETSTGRALGKSLVQRGSVLYFGFSPDGGTFFVITMAQAAKGPSNGHVLSVWDTRSRRMKWSVGVGPGDRPAFSPDCKLIAWPADGGTIGIWDVDTGKPVGSPIRLPDGGRSLVTFSPDGNVLLIGAWAAGKSAGGRVWLWDLVTGGLRFGPLPHEDGIWGQSFSPKGTYFETTIWRRGTVRLWDARSGKLLGEPLEPQNVHFRLFSVDERTFVTGRSIELVTQEGGSVRMWDSATSKPIGPVIRFNDSVAALKLSPDGTLLLAASEAGEVRFWRMPRPVEGEVKRIVSWVQVIAEMQLDVDGVMSRLDRQAWQDRKRMLDDLGGPPN